MAAAAEELLAALTSTGAIGSTVRQLAQTVETPVELVEEALDDLQRRGLVLRMGRGLWIVRDYAALDGRSDFEGPAAYDERFQREDGVPLTRYNGPITSSANERWPFHRWWPFVQGYSAEFVRGVLDGRERPPSTVLDPFCGSGTTLIEARRAGASAIGAELLPATALAARVKTRFELDPHQLGRAAREFVARARRGSPSPEPFLRETRQQFSTRALTALLRLRRALPPDGRPVDEAIRVAFGSILIPVSRLRRSPCLGYRPDGSDDGLDPFTEFESAIRRMQEDLAATPPNVRKAPPARVHVGDSRSLDLPESSVDLAVTSPPYVNGMDYVMNYKLDLAWLGYARSYADLRRLRSQMVSCDNLPRSEASGFLDTSSPPDPWLTTILEGIRTNLERKGTYRRQDVHAIVHRYFVDLASVLARVRRVLVPGGEFKLVVGDSLLAGTYVPGDLLTARIGRSMGFEIRSVEVARTRRSGQRRSFSLRESVVTLARPA